MKIAILALCVIVAFAKFETYESVVEEIFHQLNKARTDPTGYAKKLDGKAESNVKGSDKVGTLEWSAGLSRAARDLVLDNGPYGLQGHMTMNGEDEKNRAKQFTDSTTGLKEVIVYSQIEESEGDDASKEA